MIIKLVATYVLIFLYLAVKALEENRKMEVIPLWLQKAFSNMEEEVSSEEVQVTFFFIPDDIKLPEWISGGSCVFLAFMDVFPDDYIRCTELRVLKKCAGHVISVQEMSAALRSIREERAMEEGLVSWEELSVDINFMGKAMNNLNLEIYKFNWVKKEKNVMAFNDWGVEIDEETDTVTLKLNRLPRKHEDKLRNFKEGLQVFDWEQAIVMEATACQDCKEFSGVRKNKKSGKRGQRKDHKFGKVQIPMPFYKVCPDLSYNLKVISLQGHYA